MANGIAEALVATATGLFVAIMSVIFFNFYTIWLERIMERTHILSTRLVASFQGEKDAAS